MSRHRRTNRVAIEDMFAEMGPDLRADIIESLQTIDRIKRKQELKLSDAFAQTMMNAPISELRKVEAQ